MVRNYEYIVLIDTSVVWHLAFKTPLEELVRHNVLFLARLCKITYTKFNEEDVIINDKLDDEAKDKLLSAYRSIATRIDVDVSIERVRGKYGREIKNLGLHDVLIAVAAARLNAFLFTSDFGQAHFFIEKFDKKGRRLIYIPLHTLGVHIGG